MRKICWWISRLISAGCFENYSECLPCSLWSYLVCFSTTSSRWIGPPVCSALVSLLNHLSWQELAACGSCPRSLWWPPSGHVSGSTRGYLIHSKGQIMDNHIKSFRRTIPHMVIQTRLTNFAIALNLSGRQCKQQSPCFSWIENKSILCNEHQNFINFSSCFSCRHKWRYSNNTPRSIHYQEKGKYGISWMPNKNRYVKEECIHTLVPAEARPAPKTNSVYFLKWKYCLRARD